MENLVVIRTIQVHPGMRARVLEDVLAHRERSLRDEAGTLVFEVLTPVHDDLKIILFEAYADDAAITAHMKGDSMVKVREQIASRIVSINGVLCAKSARVIDSK